MYTYVYMCIYTYIYIYIYIYILRFWFGIGLLSLSERKLVLKHGNKSAAMLEKSKKGMTVKAPETWRKVSLIGNPIGDSTTTPEYSIAQFIFVGTLSNVICEIFLFGNVQNYSHKNEFNLFTVMVLCLLFY